MGNKYFVTRQIYALSDNPYCVEIAIGGIDYSNPNALAPKYEGEMEEYDSAEEAVNAAIKIHKLWKKDKPNLNIRIDIGCTLGFTMPFNNNESYKSLMQIAKKLDSNKTD